MSGSSDVASEPGHEPAAAELQRENAQLRTGVAGLREEIDRLGRQIRQLEVAAADARHARRATLNVLEDAKASRRLANELNQKLEGENTVRRRAEETLRVSEERARTLIANLPGGAVFVLDRALRCQLAEGEALRAVGVKSAELLGRPVQDILPPEQSAELTPLLLEALAGKSFLHEHESHGRAYITRGGPLRDQAGEIDAVLAVAFDITARRKVEAALENNQRDLRVALRNAQDAHRAKDQFIAALSHELRTPLTPILIAAGLGADDPKLAKSVRAQFETIRTNVKLEAQLIDDLLDQTEIATGKTRLEKQPVDVHAVLKDALLTVAADFNRKRIKPKLRLRAHTSGVRGDPVRLQQIFWNILRNAAKFTEAGGGVTVETVNLEDRIAVTVTDTGIGLSGEEITRVFQPFIQGDHAASDAPTHFGGLGLGLAISRDLAERHGGTIDAFSAGPGQGARFTVTLPVLATVAPVRPVRRPAPKRPPAAVRAAPAVRPRVALLVEDHAATRAALKVLLGRRGYTVIEAVTVRQAVAGAAGAAVDIVISDIGLPDGSGHDVIKQIKTRYPKVPAIALSGFGMKADVRKALAAGFSAHLTKPVGVEQLDALLDEMERKFAAGKK